MHQIKSKKIFLYIFLFFILGTTHNLYLNKFSLPKIDKIEIVGLNTKEQNKILKDLNFLDMHSLFFLNSVEIKKIVSAYSFVESFSIFRKFPSTLKIDIKKTTILANRYIDGVSFFIGSNGKLIKSEKKIKDIPLVFGNFINNEFLELKKMIDISNLPYLDIDSIYYFESKRWDIKMKNGILIKLPNEETLIALKLAVDLLSDDKFKQTKIIDTRLNKQIILNE